MGQSYKSFNEIFGSKFNLQLKKAIIFITAKDSHFNYISVNFWIRYRKTFVEIRTDLKITIYIND